MPITLEPFVRFNCFNFCLKALDVYFHSAITTGAPDPYKRQNSAAAGSYRQPCNHPKLGWYLISAWLFISIKYKYELTTKLTQTGLQRASINILPFLRDILYNYVVTSPFCRSSTVFESLFQKVSEETKYCRRKRPIRYVHNSRTIKITSVIYRGVGNFELPMLQLRAVIVQKGWSNAIACCLKPVATRL